MKDIIPKRRNKMKPYLEGFESFHDHKRLTDVPYPIRTDNYYNWTRGWLDAKKKEKGNDQ